MKVVKRLALAVILLVGQGGWWGGNASLPRPAPQVAEMPALVPTVITAGGQRLLLSDTDVAVRYDSLRKSLAVNRAEWWVINYPYCRTECLSPRRTSRNHEPAWYWIAQLSSVLLAL